MLLNYYFTRFIELFFFYKIVILFIIKLYFVPIKKIFDKNKIRQLIICKFSILNALFFFKIQAFSCEKVVEMHHNNYYSDEW